MASYCALDLTFPWQPYFDRHVFQNFDFPCFKFKNGFPVVSLKSLDHFIVFYSFLLPLNHFCTFFF